MKRLSPLLAAITMAWTQPATAQSHLIYGKVTNITAVTDGIMVMFDSGPPTACQNAPSGWMKITYPSIVSLVMSMWLKGGDVRGHIYVNTSNGIFCDVFQFDPDG